ncbi:uncharacterized protein LOC123685389 [Harmonia axyridis]|uniref:uncharacterized protein LOC123685389 n=1 Tax=Harmonia axyridis TaxID=115357 RepID=UPI001E276966|nr:uncharacterized protein LOC123685389 [Harmonia axyridis]
MKSSIPGLLLFGLCFQNAVALDLQLLLNNATINPLDFLIPTADSENRKCREHSLLYKEELSKFTVWATDMFDSSTKFPSGIFFGSIFDTGNFDECVKVHLPKEVGFSGQHCMAHFKIKPLNPVQVRSGHVLEYDLYENIFNITTWHKIKKYSQDGSKQSRDEVYFTFCIPSSCTYKDLEDSLKAKINLVKDFLPFTLEADVNSMNCQVERDFNFGTADFLFMGIVGAFITFGAVATLYHLITKLEGMNGYRLAGKSHDILQAFSYSHTIKKMASESNSDDGMECMHGMKTISMFLIIMGHRIMFAVSSPVENPVFVESIYRKAEFSALLNGPIVVDTFFTISGFLACYLILLEIEKRQQMVNVLMIYLHRFIRLTPAYAVVLAFYCTIFIQMGDGPFWQERIGVEQERCLETWWANLLYLNNYIMNEKMCMFQSWYLTCDTHYFLLVPFAAYLLWKKPKVGVFFCSIIILVAVVVPFIVIYKNKEEPFLLLYMKLLRDPVANKTFQSIYTPSHMRMSPYFIGVLGGYAKFRMRKSGAKIPNKIVYPTWVAGFIIAFGIIFTGFLFYVPTEHRDYVVSGLYGSLHHFLWSSCMAMLIIFVSEGYGAWFAPFLNWRPWALLGRITYTAYLCQGAILLYNAAITRSPVYTGMFNLFSFTSSDIVLSYVAGFCLSLVFESPIIQLEKIILRGTPKNDDEQAEKKKMKKKGVRNEGFVDIYIPKITTLYHPDKEMEITRKTHFQEGFHITLLYFHYLHSSIRTRKMMFSHIGVLFVFLFFGGTVCHKFEVVVDNTTVNLLDFLIPTVNSKNERCRNDSLFYRQELSRFTVWATDMFDASSKFPSGIFIGSIYDTGNFDECVKVRLPKEIGFSGQHCMAHFKLKPLEPISVKKTYSLKYDEYENIFNISTWLKIANYAQDGSKHSRDENFFSFCLPSTCSHTDVEEVLKEMIEDTKDYFPFSLDVHVDQKNCQVWRNFDFSFADQIYMAIVGSLILIGILSTVYDLNNKGESDNKSPGTLHNILKSFSFSNTCEKLTTFKINEDGFNCLNGMKVLTMCLIIMGHRIMFYISSPLSDPSHFEVYYRVFPFILLLNGPIVVDTFFTISGFLGCYMMLLEFDKRKKMMNVGLVYIHRFLRLTPAYAVVLGFYCTIFVQLGDGPFWEERIGVEHERCLASWWANLLYVNNYINVDRICMFQSWYLTCEIHFFLTLPFLSYLIWKKPKAGIFMMIVLIIISAIIPFVIILTEKEEPILHLYMKFLRDPVTNHTFQITYIPSHMRLGPYFIGIIAGYLKYKIKKSDYKLPKTLTAFTWMLFMLIITSIYVAAYTFYLPIEDKDYVFYGTYGSLHHLLWSFCISWIIIAVSEGAGSWIAPILEWKPFSFFGRITYTTYLCHGAVQLYSAGINRGPVATAFYSMATLSASDIVESFLLGFLLTLVVEGPALALENMIFRRHYPKTKKEEANIEENDVQNGNESMKRSNFSKKSQLNIRFTDAYISRTPMNDK